MTRHMTKDHVLAVHVGLEACKTLQMPKKKNREFLDHVIVIILLL
jgi:hypothetical protein